MFFNSYSQLLLMIQQDWGKKHPKERNFKAIREEFDLVKDEKVENIDIIDDQTWHDLEMDTLFLEVDQTKTFAGSLMLYKALRETKRNPEEIKKVGRELDVLIAEPKVREPIQVALAKLGKNDMQGLLYFLDRKLYFESFYKKLAYLFMVLPFIALGYMGIYGLSMLPLLFSSLMCNVVLYFIFTKYILSKKDHFTIIRNMIICANKIGHIEQPELHERTKSLKDLAHKCKSIVAKSKGLEITSNDPTGLSVYLDMLFMISIRTFYGMLDSINAHQADLVEIYKELGAMDALAGMASYRSSITDYCRPVFTEETKMLDLQGSYNPLIKSSVKNGITIRKENIYLTGSNMSGKSTFLRTVGLSALMAQTFDFAYAKSYKASIFKISSSISRNDNLLEGKSYFLAEAEIVLGMLKDSGDDITSLIIIDEIFRGTNTKERIEASAGVLNYLAHQNALVFVATHDLEIKDQIPNVFKNYHFGENVGQNGIEFDYKLKEGTTVVGNALKILKYLGYPEEMFKNI